MINDFVWLTVSLEYEWLIAAELTTHIAAKIPQHDVEEKYLTHEPEVKNWHSVDAVSLLRLKVRDIRPNQDNNQTCQSANKGKTIATFELEAEEAHEVQDEHDAVEAQH